MDEHLLRRSGPHYQPHPPAATGSPCSALVPQQSQFLRFPTYSHLPLESHMEFIDSNQVEFSQIEPSVGEPLEQRWKKCGSKHKL
ncbi:hypothetical protein RRG08_066009 [Elysia crispata]|uniref:Uncharacterized protein n=1 Tax=Elysia crispata TaxID=231223 RepID=A0AAE1CM71_9GAST|nr:hypothetical protein RRG08_066009 [Elysia crispata]